MKSNLESQRIDIPCPHCGHKAKEAISRLKRDPHLTCGACGKGYDVEASSLRDALKSVDKSLADLGRQLGKLGK